MGEKKDVQKCSSIAPSPLRTRDWYSIIMVLIMFTVISVLDIFGLPLLGMQLPRVFQQWRMRACRTLLHDEENHSCTLFSSICISVLVSIVTRNRIARQHIYLISFTMTTSQKFKFERVTSNSFHTNNSPLLTTSVKLGPHDARFVFVMRYASWFAHRVYEKMCLIWVYEVWSKSKVNFNFFQKIFIYSSISILSPSK